MNDKKISINVPVLARVEGEGALELNIENDEITHLKLKIFEPPRMFEKLLEGRHYTEVPDIVARICGICPVAYQMSAIHAFENLFETEPSPWIKSMRRLFYCGEWIQSHALHIHLLAAPDFLGFSSAPEMAKKYPDEVKRGIQIQHAGNQIIKFLGGRSVHPVGAKVGGFHYAPSAEEAKTLLESLLTLLPQVEQLLPWVSSLSYPSVKQSFNSVALTAKDTYPFIEKHIESSTGLKTTMSEYEHHFQEQHEAHSTALFSLLNGEPYLVGPLARLNLNFNSLPDNIKNAVKKVGINFPGQNMYESIIARAIEIWYAFTESISALENYEKPASPYVDVNPKPGIAYGSSEAPRGLLWHRYEVDEKGFIKNARIVPPTSQNQARMEQDLRNSITELGLDQSEDKIRLQAEQIIRNYDPCISCATHFLDLRLTRS